MSSRSAVILVGGASSRMGRDKALMEVQDQPAAIRLARLLVDSGFVNVRLIGGSGERFRDCGFAHVPDLEQDRGPLEGIRTSLRSAEEEWTLVVAVDLIALDREAIRELKSALVNHPFDDVILASCSEGPQPLFAWWRRSSIQTIERELAMERRSLRNVVGLLRVATVEFPPEVLRNANRPEDLG